jgi:alpha-beta hydrolase superfamily lysophospholipase
MWDDVGTAADMLGCEPVLIGHSMGGFVVQQYLHNRRARAAVLMATMPTHAVRRAAVAFLIMSRHPLVTLRAYTVGGAADLVNTPRLTREHFFCTHTLESVVEACAPRLQAESGRAGGLFVRTKPSRVTTPLLVLGGENDSAVTTSDMRATAHAYGARAEFFPDMRHNMMLEPGWPNVAERIQSWLTTQGI